MMKSGTRLRLVGTNIEGTVMHMRGNTFEVAWDGNDSDDFTVYSYSALFNTGPVNAYVEIIPGASLVLPTIDGTRNERAEFYAGAVGAMEYRLRDVYGSITRAREALHKQNISGAQWHLTWAADRIESTAVTLAERPVPHNGTPLTYLRDTIYEDRK